MKHLEATHQKILDCATSCPDHTCIIKATIKYKDKTNGDFSRVMYNMILDECGDSDVVNSKGAFVDPALKLFHGVPLMMNSNERIDEDLANGTPCKGLYIVLNTGCAFVEEEWEGYLVNTVQAHQVKHIVCMTENKIVQDRKYFIVKPQTTVCTVKLRSLQNEKLCGMKITHLPINCNLSTTGHKLQGRTMNSLVVNSWGYRCPH